MRAMFATQFRSAYSLHLQWKRSVTESRFPPSQLNLLSRKPKSRLTGFCRSVCFPIDPVRPFPLPLSSRRSGSEGRDDSPSASREHYRASNKRHSPGMSFRTCVPQSAN